MIPTLSALVLSTLGYAQEEDWTIDKDSKGQYLCSSDQYEYGYARQEKGDRIKLARYQVGDESDICFLIPKEFISTTTKENEITVDVGYKAETAWSYDHRVYTSDKNPSTSWSVALYTQNGSVSLRSSSWEIKEETKDWERRLGKDADNKPTVVEIPPHLEYQLCISRDVEMATVTYQRPDKQVDYINLKKVESDTLNPKTCFAIDQILVGMDGIFTVNGHYAAANPYAEPESFTPVVVFTKNGFVSLEELSDDVRKQPDHYYSKTPPTNACVQGTADALKIHFHDKDAAHMHAYAVLGAKEFPLEIFGTANPQEAAFYVPKAMVTGTGFTFYAIDAEGNRSKTYRLQDILVCQ